MLAVVFVGRLLMRLHQVAEALKVAATRCRPVGNLEELQLPANLPTTLISEHVSCVYGVPRPRVLYTSWNNLNQVEADVRYIE